MTDNNKPQFVTSTNFHGDNDYVEWLNRNAYHRDVKSFSSHNLYYMKKWYEFYMADDKHWKILYQVGAKLQETENQVPIKSHQLGAEIVSTDRISTILNDSGKPPHWLGLI